MATNNKNYSLLHAGAFAQLGEKGGRMETGKELGLTGCEVSLNNFPAGKGSAFLHTHKRNEEVYIVIGGSGVFLIDGEEIPISEGSLVRVAPAGVRGIQAGDEGLIYLCIQADQGSLKQATQDDGVIAP